MAMDSDIAKFQIGDFQARLLRDMMFSYKGHDYFINADPAQAEKELIKFGQTMDKIPSPFISLLLIRGNQKILIDTGVGFKKDPMDFKGVQVEFKGISRSLLEESDTKPEEISNLILTHFHPDHIGGVCDEHLNPIYPNAKYILHQAEYDYWYGQKADLENPLFKLFIQQNIDPIRHLDMLLINQNHQEIVAGLHAIKIPGHTPGQIALRVESNGEKLLYISDAWLHPLHIKHLDWQTSYDLDHELAKKSRIKMLELAYQESMLIQSFHFDFPGLGHIDKTSSGWHWESI
jgi:glyoxylase-like metal-dependent hydrolase (beta-lactamase superfamily II)